MTVGRRGRGRKGGHGHKTEEEESESEEDAEVVMGAVWVRIHMSARQGHRPTSSLIFLF